MERSKKGISLVALVITIVVMIILSGAVIITGISVPQDAQLAVFKSNIATMQDAVTMKMLNNQIDNVTSANKENLKWVGVVKDYDGSKEIDFSKGEVVGGVLALPLSEELTSSVNIKASELANYYITEEGIVYHRGITINGETHYNNNVVARDYTMKQVIDEGINLTQGSQVSISTAEELKSLATYTNAGKNTKGVTFKLTKDITLNKNVLNADGTLNETNASSFEEWETIGVATYINKVEDYPVTFKGIIDGNNKTISGIYINDVTKFGAGFVSCLENGIIQNLTIANSYIYGERYVGGFVGANVGGNIYNCASEDNLIVGNTYRIGGIVGCNKTGMVNNSYNTSKVVSNTTGEVGGIIGHVINGIVDTCYNTGEIISTSSYNVGGIVGLFSEYSALGDCYCTIMNSYNSAVLSCTENGGGLVGVVNNEGHYYKMILNIINSYNSQNSEIIASRGSGAGGILGKTIGNAEIVVNIINVYNAGTISDNSQAGGIDGFAYTNKNLKYCYNLFPLSTGGGISGRSASIYTIDSCYNIDSKRFAQEVTETNPGTIDSSQKLTPGVTINGTTYTTLVSALNAWVDANKTTYPELKNWELENGYPVFVD